LYHGVSSMGIAFMVGDKSAGSENGFDLLSGPKGLATFFAGLGLESPKGEVLDLLLSRAAEAWPHVKLATTQSSTVLQDVALQNDAITGSAQPCVWLDKSLAFMQLRKQSAPCSSSKSDVHHSDIFATCCTDLPQTIWCLVCCWTHYQSQMLTVHYHPHQILFWPFVLFAQHP